MRASAAGSASVDRRVELGDRERDVRAGEDAPDAHDVVARRRLVERDAERRVIDAAEVDSRGHAARENRVGARAGRDRDRVEERGGRHVEARSARAPPSGSPSVDARGARSSRGPPGRDRPRTSPRSPRAAPARCRCSRSPFRAGCAARASAARADTRVRRPHRR